MLDINYFLNCERKGGKESMKPETNNIMTIQELKAYLNSLNQEKKKTIAQSVYRYKKERALKEKKIRKREIAKIEKSIDKEYIFKFKLRDEILELLNECKNIPENIEKLEITEYMLYRVDIRKAEKVVNNAAKRFSKRYAVIKEEISERLNKLLASDEECTVDYSEFQTMGEKLANTKEQYKFEYTEEEKNKLVENELEVVKKAIEFNSVPIPHEILKSSDREIQLKMQKFNNIRQKRIRILSSMSDDYKKLIEPREILGIIDDAMSNIKLVHDILTKAEFSYVKSSLVKRKKKVERSTNDIRYIIRTKEKKTGIDNFNVQVARYERMDYLRGIIVNATKLIEQNPIEYSEEQLEKLEVAYEREKQFASVIENLNGNYGPNSEVRAYEEQIYLLRDKISRAKKIITEQQENIKKAKQELLVLWKIEINSAVIKKKEGFRLLAPAVTPKVTKNVDVIKVTNTAQEAMTKLKKNSRGKHAVT